MGLIALDLLVGAPLQLNTTFGYSVAVAGRFTGLGNLAFALFGSATIVLAALIVDRTGPRGVRVAVGLMAAVVVVEGLPMLGADVGGVLAMVPAFGVTALVLLGRRIRAREVVGLVVATGGGSLPVRPRRRGPAARGPDAPGPLRRAGARRALGPVLEEPRVAAGRPASAGPSWPAGSPSGP